MKTFFKKIFIFGSLLFGVIAIFYSFNRILIEKANFLKIGYDVNKIVIGASRTACAIDDNYLNNTLNISHNADALLFSMIKLRQLKINNRHIDTVFLSLDCRTLDIKTANYFYDSPPIKSRIPKYAHYFTLHEWNQLFNINYTTSLRSIFIIPKYTLKLFKSIITGSDNKIEDLKIGGYERVENLIEQDIIDNFMKNDSVTNYNFSNIEIDNLYRIVEFCKSNKISLIFINPPLHAAMYNSLEYQVGMVKFKKFMNNNLPSYTYLDFSNKFLPDSCYADLVHLNKKGAKIFSEKLEYNIKNYRSAN